MVDADDASVLGGGRRHEYLDFIKKNYKLLVLYYYEEFNNSYKFDDILKYCLDIKLPLYIFTRNIIFKKFFNNKYGKIENIWIQDSQLAFDTLNFVDVPRKKFNKEYNFNVDKDINLLFLYFNRKPNRDFIIQQLYNRNELYDSKNYISFHNFLGDVSITKYENKHKKYATETNLDFDFLRELKIVPNHIEIGNQLETQEESFFLHARSKFNIICESVFGYDIDETSYDYHNFVLTKKTILPLIYKNVFFIHEYNNMFSTELKNIGFKMFFDNIDDFFSNMNDEFYYLESTQEILNHNRKLVFDYILNSRFDFLNELKLIVDDLQ